MHTRQEPMTTRDLLRWFIYAAALSILGYIAALIVFLGTVVMGVDIAVFGCKSPVLMPMIVGMPLGGTIGIYIAKRRNFQKFGHTSIELITAFIFGVIFIVVGLYAIDKMQLYMHIGNILLITFPLIVAFGCVLGCVIKCKLTKKAA